MRERERKIVIDVETSRTQPKEASWGLVEEGV